MDNLFEQPASSRLFRRISVQGVIRRPTIVVLRYYVIRTIVVFFFFFSRVPSHVQGTVLEPCPRLDVQLNKSMDPLGRAVDGTESTSDVVCRLFGTTITTRLLC